MYANDTPFPVRRALKKLGEDLRDARRRRRISMKLAAARGSLSRTTLSKIERGEEGVSLGAYARIIFVYGLIDRLAGLVDPSHDFLGLVLDAEHLPKRIRTSRKEKRQE